MIKRKILIFNGYYYPAKNCGGPVTSIENIVNACSDEYEFYIVCYNHDWNDDTPYDVEVNNWIVVGRAHVMYVEKGYLDFSISRMSALFKFLKPSLVWFSGVLMPNNKIVAAIAGHRMNIPILFSPRGEVSADRVKIKGYKKIPYLWLIRLSGIFNGCYFHGTSNDEIDGLRKYFSPESNHIFRIANIAIMQQPELTGNGKIEGTLRAMFFSRIHEVKNLLYAIKCICNCKRHIVYDIYGPIESKEYWQECLNVCATAPKNVEINYKGVLSKSELNKTIQEHDCFLFPTINENYGHVIAESLANSRPVILSKGTTPWDDMDGRGGYVISLDEPNTFAEKIDYYASLSNEDYKSVINNTKNYFTAKILDNGAIEGHKNMFKFIIGQSVTR